MLPVVFTQSVLTSAAMPSLRFPVEFWTFSSTVEKRFYVCLVLLALGMRR